MPTSYSDRWRRGGLPVLSAVCLNTSEASPINARTSPELAAGGRASAPSASSVARGVPDKRRPERCFAASKWRQFPARMRRHAPFARPRGLRLDRGRAGIRGKKANYTLRIATGLGGARSGTHRLDQASTRAEMARLFSTSFHNGATTAILPACCCASRKGSARWWTFTTTPTCRKWRTGTATTFSRSTGRCWIMATPSASTMRQFATLICVWHRDTDELLFEGASRSEH